MNKITKRYKKLFTMVMALLIFILYILNNGIVLKANDYIDMISINEENYGAELKLTTNKDSYKQGDEILVYFEIKQLTDILGISSFSAYLSYDPAIFKCIEIITPKDYVLYIGNTGNNQMFSIMRNSSGVTPIYSGELCQLKFKILQDAMLVESTIKMFNIEVFHQPTGVELYAEENQVNEPLLKLEILPASEFDYYAGITLQPSISSDELAVKVIAKELYNVGNLKQFWAFVNYDTNILKLREVVGVSGYENHSISSTGRIGLSYIVTPTINQDDLICTLIFKILKKEATTIVGIYEIDITGTLNDPYFDDTGTVNTPQISINLSVCDTFSYNIDYTNHQLIVTNGSNNILFLGSEDKKGIVKSYELFEAGSNTTKIDLSKFSTKKEWKLKLYGDIDTTPISISLAARANKVKATYNPLETTAAARITFTDNGNPVVLNKLEYRTSYSKWNDSSTLTIDQLDAYSVHGTTLIFRIKAKEDKNPYSAEAKMKIAKKANAPKVTLNYSNLTIKMSDKMEYRTSHSDTWKTGIKGAVSINNITNIETNNLYLEVRTAATNRKAASKIAVITLAAQDNAPVIDTNLKITNNTTEGKTTSITIKNGSTDKIIEYALVDKNTQIISLDLTKQKWKKLNKGSEVTLKEKESNGKKIIARYAAVTTKGETPEFASNISISNEIVWIK